MSDIDCCGCFGGGSSSQDNYRYVPAEDGTKKPAGNGVTIPVNSFPTPVAIVPQPAVNTHNTVLPSRPPLPASPEVDHVPWDDPDFNTPTTITVREGTFSRVEWMRPFDIAAQFGQKAKFIDEDASRYDINQGKLGDCWYLTALACMTSLRDKSLLSNCMPGDQDFGAKYTGRFRFRFWSFGEWQDVYIDDRLPTVRESDGVNRLIFARNDSQPNEFWVPLMEKAFVKLRNGRYDNLEVGNANTALVSFTGGVSFNYVMNSAGPDLYSRLDFALNRKSGLISCITPDQDCLGLVRSHVYCVSGTLVVQLQGRMHQLLRILNPWGKTEWQGRWSDGSPEFEAIKQQFQLTAKNEGEFWICYEDFRKYFAFACVCFPNPTSMDHSDVQDNESWKEIRWFGRWNGPSAAGSNVTDARFWSNPQYNFTVSSPPAGSHVVISVLQKTDRSADNVPISFYLFQVRNDPTSNSSGTLDPSNYGYRVQRQIPCPVFSADSEVSAMLELEPGCYVAIPCTHQPGVEIKFLLRVFTETNADARRLDIPAVTGSTTNYTTGRATGGHSRGGIETSSDQMSALFKRFSGGDDQMDCTEFAAALNHICEADGISTYSPDKAMNLLRMLGTTRSQLLNVDEFRTAIDYFNKWKNEFKSCCSGGSTTKQVSARCLRRVFPSKIGAILTDNVLTVVQQRYTSSTDCDQPTLTMDAFVDSCCRIVCMLGEFDRYSKNGLAGRAEITLSEWLTTMMLY